MLVLPDTDKEKEVRYCLKAIISNNLNQAVRVIIWHLGFLLSYSEFDSHPIARL